jgi:hypothetical protein
MWFGVRPWMCLLLLVPAVARGDSEVSFNRDVRPILSDRCFGCHGPDAVARKIPLRLDVEASARKVLNTPDSALVRRITASNAALRMPPVSSGLKLSEKDIETLKTWVAQGAKWERHWSFLPPVAPPLPATQRSAWTRNPIDAFVLARLEREGIQPSPEASKQTLIRRVSLDLTGIPPTPEEVDVFVKDTSPDAWEKVVDRLLASPRYGEKMAIRWLDAARYADTNGYQTDAERYMWRWRDWVIDAFNRNMPYDQFTVEQIAGDLLPNATLDQRIATGFSRNHRGNSEGGIVPEEYLVEYAVDRVDTMSTVFLGLTLGCARCHNHKYDPFTQREYYQLFAYFNNIPELGRYLKYGNTPPFVKAPTAEQSKRLAELDRAVAAAERSWSAMGAKAAAAQVAWEKTVGSGAEWLPDKALVANVKPEGPFDGKRMVDAGDKGAFGFYSRFSAAAWIDPRKATGPIVTRAQDKDDDAEGWGLYLVDGRLQVNLIKRRLDDSIRVQTRDVLKPGRHHVAMSYDGSRVATGVQVYVDGEPQRLDIILDAINQDFATKEPLRVGGAGGFGPPFTGSIDEVRVYSRVLPEEEVAMLATRRTLKEIASLPSKQRTAGEERRLHRAWLALGAETALREAWKAREQARDERDSFDDTIQTAMVMEEIPAPKDTFILQRGAYDRPGEKVARGVPEVLNPLPAGSPANRLGLARWLVDPANPLTARVAVNRFWQMYFGTGIVKTVEDFGSQGEWPSHPELLDWLATEFVRSGWDVKKLQKLIMMSATYRQSSAVRPELVTRDPENRLLARAPRLRLPAEVLRDQALAVSGLLAEKIGGPSARPYQPAGLWSELGGADYQPDKGEGLYRRSVYTFWKRTAPPPFMANFDSALRESCTVRESRTNTPLQALNLMNGVQFVEAARSLAQRVMRDTPPADRLGRAFRLVLARPPSDLERQKLTASLAFYSDQFKTRPEAAAKLIGTGASSADAALDQADLASWTMICSLVLNLDEAVTKE